MIMMMKIVTNLTLGVIMTIIYLALYLFYVTILLRLWYDCMILIMIHYGYGMIIIRIVTDNGSDYTYTAKHTPKIIILKTQDRSQKTR